MFRHRLLTLYRHLMSARRAVVPGGGGNVLLEDGTSFLLIESGDKLLLE